MGGEKLAFPAILARELGSPPRGRGKVFFRKTAQMAHRITPAWAGKSCTEKLWLILYEDHPRVGGEKRLRCVVVFNVFGSPPRGRGKVHVGNDAQAQDRITPAWAGKSKITTVDDLLNRDHPRVGGEKPTSSAHCQGPSGSPPRGRGKD